MKSIRRKINKKNKIILIGLIGAIILATFCYTRFINPLSTRAEAVYMTATITDDNGTVDFSPGINDAVAEMSYSKADVNSAETKLYDVKIKIVDLPANVTEKKVSISLPVGMLWVDDASNDENLLTQIDNIETIPVGQEAVLGYRFNNSGTKVYHISDNAIALAINVKVRADKMVAVGYIADAIKAELQIGDTKEVASVDVNIPQGYPANGRFATTTSTIYVAAGDEFSENRDYMKFARGSYIDGYYATTRLVKSIKVNYHVSDSNVRLVLKSDAAATYSIDSSDAENGNYTITWTATASSNGVLNVPYVVLVPEDATDGSSFTITGNGESVFWQPSGEDLLIPFSNTQVITYVILPDTDNGVTVGFKTLNPSHLQSSGTAADVTTTIPTREGDDMVGILGYTYVNNKSARDSNRKTIHVNLDTEVYGAMDFRLPCVPNGTIGEIKYKTVGGNSGTKDVGVTCGAYGISGLISYVDIGTAKADYFSEIEYEIGVIPAGTQLRQSTLNDGTIGLAIIGRRLDETTDGTTTVEIYDTDNPANTTGIAKIISRNAARTNFSLSTMATQKVNAGETMNFSITIGPYGSTNMAHIAGVRNPIIYIRQEVKDAAGNFLPISNLKITNGAGRGDRDITSQFGQITYEDTDTARVYKIDGRNVPNGGASLSTHAISDSGEEVAYNLVISYSIETSLTTPGQTHNISDMIFVQDPDASSVSASSDLVGNRFGIGDGGDNMVSAATTNYYQIRGWASIGVENSGKHTSSSDWLTWAENSNPITIGSTEGSLADMKVTMINNSGVEVPGPTTIYFPIPKKDQNWNSLNYDNHAFEFSTALTGAISNSGDYFTIAYGKSVTPTDNGADLDNQASKFTTNTSGWTENDWKDVNCIRITAVNIPANNPGETDEYDFIYQLRVIDASNASNAALDTWRPIYFQQLTNSAGDVFAGWYKGSYVSVKLADGKITGQIFVDANENGKKDSDESDLKEAGWTIDLYDASSNRLVQSMETDANGRYSFIELSTSANSYYVTVTNKHPISGSGTTYLFTPKGTPSTSDNYVTDNQAEGSTDTNPAHSTAYIGLISPSQNASEAIYNIGVVEYVATEAYSGKVTFNDEGNAFGFRPANVIITATASDGSTQAITASTSGNGNFSANLPKYNSRGEKLSYTFSAPDQTGYTKADEIKDNGYTYNIVYTLKTVSLDSDISISAPDSVSDKTTSILYDISYKATLSNYMGDATITIVQKLPYPIVETNSDLDGGSYSATNKTITWTETRSYGSYVEGAVIELSFAPELVYDGAGARDTLASSVNTSIMLSGKNHAANDNVETAVLTPSRIRFSYIGPDGEPIEEPDEEEGYVGDVSNHIPPEIPGYVLVVGESPDLAFGEDEHEVIYRYVVAVPPQTGDNIYALLTIGGVALAGASVVLIRRRR